MSTDLETELREALHDRVARITARDLAYATGPRRSIRRVRRPATSWILAAALVLVAIVAVGGAVLFDRSGDDEAAHLRSRVVGVHWTMTDAEVGNEGAGPGPGSVRLTLRRDGTYSADDSKQPITGRYRIAGDRIVFTPRTWREVHPDTGDQLEEQFVGGFDAAVLGDGTGAPISTHAYFRYGQFALDVGRYRLIFDPCRDFGAGTC